MQRPACAQGAPPRQLGAAPVLPPRRCSCAHHVPRGGAFATPRRPRTGSPGGSGPVSCGVLPPALWTVAGTDPGLLQDVIVGSAITAAVGIALYSGLKRDPVPCDLCMGTGGIKCFACEGSGERGKVKSQDGGASPRPRRDPVGRSGNPRACRVCNGTGLVLCSRCKGSGYLN